ncbi:uncharacterized protein BKCO1_950004 [Diplodia corticola]|uniref:Uncharacterized protein n=1 Tax=Diplodia corticola TaxID=236234 RepID=A0A1J9RKL2_9PEZI|nr:uncharacterized protein BKCO1_950004 [Diplodia corticola]OJD29063.1 hypothetical protein BKCO1_950004 [Diplodia corticola]
MDHPFQLDYERWDGNMLATKEQQAQFARYRAGHQAIPPDQESDTHPRVQPYKAAVTKFRKTGHKGPTTIFDPTDPIPRGKSAVPSTPTSGEDFDETSSLNDFFGPFAMPDGAFHHQRIAVSGRPEALFESASAFRAWLRQNGARTSNGVHLSTTLLIQAGLSPDPTKDQKARDTPGVRRIPFREFMLHSCFSPLETHSIVIPLWTVSSLIRHSRPDDGFNYPCMSKKKRSTLAIGCAKELYA